MAITSNNFYCNNLVEDWLDKANKVLGMLNRYVRLLLDLTGLKGSLKSFI